TVQYASNRMIQRADHFMSIDGQKSSEEDLTGLLSLTLAHKLETIAGLPSNVTDPSVRNAYQEIIAVYFDMANRMGLSDLGDAFASEVVKRLDPLALERVHAEVEKVRGTDVQTALTELADLKRRIAEKLDGDPDFEGALILYRVKKDR